MKLWVNGKAGSVGSAIWVTIKDQVTNTNRKLVFRDVRAVNVIYNKELEVLKGQHSSKVYRKPYNKKTYTARAPREPPVRCTGSQKMKSSYTMERPDKKRKCCRRSCYCGGAGKRGIIRPLSGKWSFQKGS